MLNRNRKRLSAEAFSSAQKQPKQNASNQNREENGSTTLRNTREKPLLAGYKNSNFENETNCKTFLVKMSFICMTITNHFHMSGFAHSLPLTEAYAWITDSEIAYLHAIIKLSIFLFKGNGKINTVQAGSQKFCGITRVRFSTSRAPGPLLWIRY